MQSFYLIPFLSLLFLGCASTSPEQDESVEVDGEQTAAVAPQTEPCPTPAQPLVKPDAESANGGQVENAGPLVTNKAETFVEEAPAGETETPEVVAVKPETSDAVALPPEADVKAAPPAEPQPDARSHMNVEDVPPEVPDQRDYYVTAPGLNVRSGPSGESPVVRSLKLGEKVKSFGREGIWVQIGREEYVSIVYLGDQPNRAQVDNSSK